MSKNLHLQFKFTDRGGNLVYEIHEEEDNKRLKHPMGSIRIPQGHDANTAAAIHWVISETEAEAPEQGELELDERTRRGDSF